MKKLVRYCLIITIFLLGTQIIKLPAVGLSPFQLMVILTGVVGLPFAFMKGFINGLPLMVSVLWFFSTIIAWLISINPEIIHLMCGKGISSYQLEINSQL